MSGITVVLPTFRGARFLVEQLRSLTEQTRAPDEVIVCDDGSDDSTADLAEATLREAPFASRVIRAENVGWVLNCERGLGLVGTEFVAFCDQDDVWMANKLEVQLRLLRDHDLCIANAQVVDEALRPIGVNLTSAELNFVRERGVLAALLRYNIAQNATIVGRTRLIRDVMPTPPGVSFDAWVALAIAALGADIAVEESPLLLYRQHASNQLGSTRGQSLRGRLRIARSVVRESRGHRQRAAESFAEQQARLRTLGITPQVDELLCRKAAHLQRRAKLPERWPLRMLAVGAEALRGNYTRYGRGRGSVLRDLLM